MVGISGLQAGEDVKFRTDVGAGPVQMQKLRFWARLDECNQIECPLLP